ncbi:hypothetical protein M426DRAFT_320172 [Hypoxylon sp. CI-4A]|nr:hypothetical protein M426DRAFT_320172 [Hypoxylon sp. CI-4A]
MLYDLNIAWSPTTTTADLERTLRFSRQLGYNVVAINHTLEAPLPSQIPNPLPKFPPPSSAPENQNQNQNRKPTTILRRLTVSFADPAQNPQLSRAAQAYDLVAVRPTTDKAFQTACLSVSTADAALISLDLTRRLPFHLRPKPCMAAVRRGLRFEICYGAAVVPAEGAGADARARAAFAGNVAQLVRATGGRGLVVSSGGEAVGGGNGGGVMMALRAPADVVNLLNVWGLSTERGMEALSSNPRGVVVNEGIKRSGFRGIVDVVAVAGRSAEEVQRIEVEREKEKGKGGKDNNKKRKNGGGEEVAAKDGGGGDGDGSEQAAPLSKRQAKKLKAALRKKEVDEKGA